MSTVTVRAFLRSTSFSEDEHDQDPMEFVTSRFARDRQNSISETNTYYATRTSRNSQCFLRSQETILEHEYKYRSGIYIYFFYTKAPRNRLKTVFFILCSPEVALNSFF